MGGITVLSGLLSIPADPPLRQKGRSAADAAARRVDWLGALLITVGLVFIVFVLSDGEIAPQGWRTGCTSTRSCFGRGTDDAADIIALLIIGVLLIAAFLYWQTVLERAQHTHAWAAPPLVRPGLWTRAHGKLAAVMAVAFLNWCCFLAWTFWVQLYYQQYLGLTPILTMVRLIPMSVTGVLANVVVALAVGRVNVVILIGASAVSARACACLRLRSTRDGADRVLDALLRADRHARELLGVRLPCRDLQRRRHGLRVQHRHALRRKGRAARRAEPRGRALPHDDAARHVLRAHCHDDRVRPRQRAQRRARGVPRRAVGGVRVWCRW
jgi:hypothetical protein